MQHTLDHTTTAADGRIAAEPGERLLELDGLRAIAVISVLLWHYLAIPLTTLPGPIRNALAVGRSGVDLFFVLSGFLIGGILLRNRTATNLFTVFYLRRAARIWPVYYAILLLWIIGRHVGAAETESMIPTWQYPLFLQNFGMADFHTYGTRWLGVTWSLAIEEQFYLLFPLLVVFTSRLTLTGVLFLILAFAPAVRVTSFYITGDEWFLYTSLPGRADALACGALIAIAWNTPTVCRRLCRHARLIGIALLAVSPGLAVLAWITPASPMWGLWGHSYLNVFYTLVLLWALTQGRGSSTRFLRTAPLRIVARGSYTIYLVHPIALVLAASLLRPDSASMTWTVGVALAITGVVAWLSGTSRWSDRSPASRTESRTRTSA